MNRFSNVDFLEGQKDTCRKEESEDRWADSSEDAQSPLIFFLPFV
jgi:hypothetical protein